MEPVKRDITDLPRWVMAMGSVVLGARGIFMVAWWIVLILAILAIMGIH